MNRKVNPSTLARVDGEQAYHVELGGRSEFVKLDLYGDCDFVVYGVDMKELRFVVAVSVDRQVHERLQLDGFSRLEVVLSKKTGLVSGSVGKARFRRFDVLDPTPMAVVKAEEAEERLPLAELVRREVNRRMAAGPAGELTDGDDDTDDDMPFVDDLPPVEELRGFLEEVVAERVAARQRASETAQEAPAEQSGGGSADAESATAAPASKQD